MKKPPSGGIPLIEKIRKAKIMIRIGSFSFISEKLLIYGLARPRLRRKNHIIKELRIYTSIYTNILKYPSNVLSASPISMNPTWPIEL